MVEGLLNSRRRVSDRPSWILTSKTPASKWKNEGYCFFCLYHRHLRHNLRRNPTIVVFLLSSPNREPGPRSQDQGARTNERESRIQNQEPRTKNQDPTKSRERNGGPSSQQPDRHPAQQLSAGPGKGATRHTEWLPVFGLSFEDGI